MEEGVKTRHGKDYEAYPCCICGVEASTHLHITETQLRTMIRGILNEVPVKFATESKSIFFSDFIKSFRDAMRDDEYDSLTDAIELVSADHAGAMHTKHEWKRMLYAAQTRLSYTHEA